MTDRDQELVDRYYAAFHKELARANTLEKQLAEAEKKLREQVKLLSEEYRFRQQMEKDAHEKQLAEVTRERDEARAKSRVDEKLGMDALAGCLEQKLRADKAEAQLAAQAEHYKTSQALRAAVFALLSKSVEAYQLIGPAAKPAHEYDEYDVMMAPLWRAVYDACDHVGAALSGPEGPVAPAAPKEHK